MILTAKHQFPPYQPKIQQKINVSTYNNALMLDFINSGDNKLQSHVQLDSLHIKI